MRRAYRAFQLLHELGDVVAALSHKGVRTTDAHILTYRNNLNKIFGTVYNRKDDWEVGVERCADGTVLLHVMDTERKRAEEARRDAAQARDNAREARAGASSELERARDNVAVAKADRQAAQGRLNRERRAHTVRTAVLEAELCRARAQAKGP